jgi:serine protease Do
MGLSFAIPVNVAQEVISQLMDKGTVSRGWLGVLIQEVTPDLAESFSLDKPIGALVSQVVRGSPAESAGLQAGDIILELDSHEIVESSDLPHVVGLIRPGKEVAASVMREGKMESIKVKIGELSERGVSALPTRVSRDSSRATASYFGMTVLPLDSALVDATGVEEGVVVETVETDSPADRAGIVAGDIIVQIGFAAIASPEDLKNVSDSARSGSVVPIRFFRNGNPVFRTLQVE